MRKLILPLFIVLTLLSCNRGKQAPVVQQNSDTRDEVPAGLIPVAKDIVTEVIVRPDTTGDPWEAEKVAGYNGDAMVSGIYENIYNRKLTVKDYHTGTPLTPDDVRQMEKEFKRENSMIGKLSFTEDWYFDPATNAITKKVKSVVFGYERYDNNGKVLGYKAIFSVEPSE